ncbi:MAG: phage holin family protein [Bacteroides sp.]|nr:phage holin family protein [Bacteroides sp.]MDE6231225.1 phage holin family protein [Muribaculaceae bacterium]
MRSKLIEEIRTIFEQSKTWVTLEVEYAKLTLAEKATMLLSALIIGFVCLLLGIVVLILLGFSLAEAFMQIVSPWLAFLIAAGIICVLIGIVFLLRGPILLNPIAKLITRIFFENKH